GAANVAKIISHYSENTYLLGAIGKDQFSFRIKKLLKKYNIKDFLFNYDKTIVKTRLIAQNNQQIARVDRENDNLKIPSKVFEEKILNKELGINFDAVFLIDYNKGLFTKENVELVKSTFKSRYYISIKPANFNSFLTFFDKEKKQNNKSLVNLLSINKSEFNEISKMLLNNKANLTENMISFLSNYNLINLLVTMGKEGLCLVNKENFIKIDGIEVEVFDVTGAGDNVISVFGIFDCVGFDPVESGLLANIAGSICVSKPGTIAVKPKDIINFLQKTQKFNPHFLESLLNHR
ncbi:MAG: PfkB family carbohydrate kinase, partial [bacterium]